MVKVLKTWCPKCFKALSTPVRSRIVNLLQDGQEHPVMEIVSHFKLTQPTVSYHLAKLERSRLIDSRSVGRHVFYRLNRGCPYDEERCILK